MADAEVRVNAALMGLAHHVTRVRPDRAAWVPYWARLAHLDLLADLPETLRAQYSPEVLPTILMRSRDVNASTCVTSGAQVIVLDYALEPLLKSMNVFLASYYGSRDMAGPKRLKRALAELIPRVLFFKGVAPAQALPPLSLLFKRESFLQAKAVTDAQIRFLVAHELAHVVFRHPGARAALPCASESDLGNHIEQIRYEHMYEYEADSFAMTWQCSRVLNKMRYFLHPKRSRKTSQMRAAIKALNMALVDYAERYESIRTLFLIMKFVEECYERLASMVPALPKRTISGHPMPMERWNRLQACGVSEAPIDSEFNRYGEYILKGALDLLNTLSGTTIDEILEEAGKK